MDKFLDIDCHVQVGLRCNRHGAEGSVVHKRASRGTPFFIAWNAIIKARKYVCMHTTTKKYYARKENSSSVHKKTSPLPYRMGENVNTTTTKKIMERKMFFV
eukprot:GEMP01132713.1.p1 GENE.GEMP01132713.1~~GEMP01132713.1.p1  ORF type:complete len:102 (+),score=5.74 GEMP01132713.1:53-358(+)